MVSIEALRIGGWGLTMLGGVTLIDGTLVIVLHMANRKSRVSWHRRPMPCVSRS